MLVWRSHTHECKLALVGVAPPDYIQKCLVPCMTVHVCVSHQLVTYLLVVLEDSDWSKPTAEGQSSDKLPGTLAQQPPH